MVGPMRYSDGWTRPRLVGFARPYGTGAGACADAARSGALNGRDAMSQTSTDPGSAETDFRSVMAYVTERAEIDGLEEEVMAALYDVFDEALQRRDHAD
jgi:hypothetical protein